ncbi:membrane-bound serine protease (ClpP class) [Tistlia consotensis]|uniref:Membrane-bound serine protease (ClpP class) n=1 Tax=Tistlia consotensis USBA 355 TaxID=560819 RepID=A0A1Y6B923_9PROT|nr:nodulation protein NfeD [Tistlia consotensis]SME99300.1 membrane-bound serine protease (ClpP class) [Tistlia consotensis USBA 355]SNR77122.1 membrane-bound serine protease (ClpP class) [Tistlia consotensis]
MRDRGASLPGGTAWPRRAPGGRPAWAAGLALLLWLFLAPAAGAAPPQAYLLDLNGAVGPVTADYVVRGLEEAAEAGAAVVVLRLDTPGGLDSSMREIVRAILASPVPVVGYVAPSGARAASAGTFILYACPIAAMAPGTNLGAATPVNLMGGGGSAAPGRGDAGTEDGQPAQAGQKPGRPADAEMTKVTNDAVAYIRGLARLNGRNADWAERAIREAASLPYDEALKQNVVNLVAPSVPQLLRQLDGRQVEVAGETRTLQLAGAAVVPVAPGWRTRLLSVLTDPTVAYLLLLVGAYGLVLEFAHPGIFAPGVIGSISLLLGLLALSIIPIDLAGLGLTVLGLALMVAEAFVPSFGALGIGGLVAFVLGSLMTFDTPGYQLALPVVIGAAAASAGLFLLVLALLVRARRRPLSGGEAALVGARAEVLDWSDGAGEVQVLGELWRARADAPLAAGQGVRVVGRDGLTLRVEPE